MSTTAPSESVAVRTLYHDAAFRVDVSSEQPSTLRCSPAAGEVRGVLVFVHGLAEHPARHLFLAKRLAAVGVRTVLPSLAGHAFSTMEAGAIAGCVCAYASSDSAAHVASALEACEDSDVQLTMARLRGQLATLDMHALVDQIRQSRAAAAADCPAGVVQLWGGMSLGGLVAIAAAQQHDPKRDPSLDGLILVNPALAPCGPPRSALQRMIVRLVWRLRVAGLPLGPLLGAAARLMPVVDVRWVSAYVSDVLEEQRLQAIDPFVHRALPGRFLVAIQDLMLVVRSGQLGVCTQCLVLLAARDAIVDPRGAREFIERASGSDTQCIESAVFAEQISHELLRSSDTPAAMARIERWVSQRIGAGS